MSSPDRQPVLNLHLAYHLWEQYGLPEERGQTGWNEAAQPVEPPREPAAGQAQEQ
jgi:hypothetical protein